MKIQAIIQARMNSSRLPGKIIEKIGAKTAIEHVYQRCVMSNVDEVVVAVPSLDDARALQPYQKGRIFIHEDDENDVLGRLHAAADGDIIVRLTADTPFVPWTAIMQSTSMLMMSSKPIDYVETRSDPSGRPNGLDVQVFTRALLQQAHENATDAYSREHVTPALYAHARYPARVSEIEGIDLDKLPPWRLTLDTQDDLDWMRSVHEAGLSVVAHNLTLRALMRFFMEHPEMQRYDIDGYMHHTAWHQQLSREGGFR